MYMIQARRKRHGQRQRKDGSLTHDGLCGASSGLRTVDMRHRALGLDLENSVRL